MEEDNIKKRIEKLKSHVIKGVKHEKDNAERALRALCLKHDIEYDDLFMSSKAQLEYKFPVSDDQERKIFVQILYRYGGVKETFHYVNSPMFTTVIFSTTPSLYLEVMGIWEVLKRAYRKERKKVRNSLRDAFIQKHHLYAPKDPEAEEEEREYTEEELAQYRYARKLAETMEDVSIQKQLTA